MMKCEPSVHSFKITVDKVGARGVAWIDGTRESINYPEGTVNAVEVLLCLTREHGHDFEGAIPDLMMLEYSRQEGNFITAKIYESGESGRKEYTHHVKTVEDAPVLSPEEDEEEDSVEPYEFKDEDNPGDIDLMPDTPIWYRRRLVQHARTVLGLSKDKTAQWLESEHGIKVSPSTVHKDRVAVQNYWAKEAVEDYKRHQAILLSKLDAREREATDKYAECLREVENLEARYEEVRGLDPEENPDKHNILTSLSSQIIKAKDQSLKWFAMAGKEIDRSSKAIGAEQRARVAMETIEDGKGARRGRLVIDI